MATDLTDVQLATLAHWAGDSHRCDMDAAAMVIRAVAELRAARLHIASLEAARTRAVEALGEACDTLENAADLLSESVDREELREERDRIVRLRAIAAESAHAPVEPRPAMTEGDEQGWLVVRVLETDPPELWRGPFGEMEAIFESAGINWTDTYLARIVVGPRHDGRGRIDERRDLDARTLPPAPVEPLTVLAALADERVRAGTMNIQVRRTMPDGVVIVYEWRVDRDRLIAVRDREYEDNLPLYRLDWLCTLVGAEPTP